MAIKLGVIGLLPLLVIKKNMMLVEGQKERKARLAMALSRVKLPLNLCEKPHYTLK